MTSKLWIDIPNPRFPFEGVCTGGRPRPRQLQQARTAGIKMVVSLCSPSERDDYDEATLAAAFGMRYLNIPVAGPSDLTLANAQLLADALVNTPANPVLVHCISSNRVGALFALKAHQIDNLGIERSIAVGRLAGLTTLESEVRCILSGF